MKTFVKLIAITVTLIWSGALAYATPTLVYSGSDIVGINGLDVDGILYDLTWQEGSYDAVYGSDTPTFLNDEPGALAATNAIINFFNLETVEPFYLGGGLVGTNSDDADLVIPYLLATSTMTAYNVDWDQPNGPWELQPQTWNRDFDNDLVAMTIFTPSSAVPEPTTMLLFGVGIAGIAAVGRKRSK